MTNRALSRRDKTLKIVSWVLLSLVPVLVVAVIGIFSYGMNTQEYIDKIEFINDEFSTLKPLAEQNKIDIVKLNSEIQQAKKTVQDNDNEFKLLKDDVHRIDNNITKLITLFEENEKRAKDQRVEQIDWMHRIEDRINGLP